MNGLLDLLDDLLVQTRRAIILYMPQPPKLHRFRHLNTVLGTAGGGERADRGRIVRPKYHATPWPATPFLSLLYPDRLHIREFTNAHCPQFPSVSRPLHPAKWNPRIGGHHTVDENHPRIQFVDELLLLGSIVRPGARPQSESTIIRNPDGIVNIFGPEHARHRAKQLLSVSRRVFRDVDEHGRRIEISRAGERLSSGQHLRAHFHGFPHVTI